VFAHSSRVGSNGPDVRCLDCGQRLLPDGRDGHQWYMVRDQVWDQTSLAPLGGCLCLACLEARLGRALTWRDLDQDAGPINRPSELDAPKLRALKVAAASAETGKG